MTDTEWLQCADPRLILAYHQHATSDRKLRLFAVACCRAEWALAEQKPSSEVIAALESWADGQATPEQIVAAAKMAAKRPKRKKTPSAGDQLLSIVRIQAMFAAPLEAATAVSWYSTSALRESPGSAARYNEVLKKQCDYLRDLFGRPFGHVAIDAAWRKSNHRLIPRLAQAIYEEGAFDRIPILADALEDAGCTNAAILDHCRQPGEHVRGCWVVDLLLGKK
ncbi:MAG: hypothetical protein K2R98_25915 [Gemmataceae bacterium]|nr:hypothetical protein [Gemmataceae bacterium]